MRLFAQSLYNKRQGSSYYLSETGSDNNDGLSSVSAWKTLDKLQANISNFKEGSSVYFNGGDTFYGKLDLSNSINGTVQYPITFNSYGTGTPILTGAKDVTGWVNEGANIWSKDMGVDTAYHVIKDDVFASASRFPKYIDNDSFRGNFASISSWSGQNTIIVPDFIGLSDVVGAQIFIQPRRWVFEQRKVLSFNSTTGQIVLDSDVFFSNNGNYECFLLGHENLLTQQNEWFFDDVIKKLKIYSVTEPLGFKAVTINDNCLTVDGISNYTLKNIKITGYNQYGVGSENIVAKNIKIDNCEIINCTDHSIYSLISDNWTITNNLIKQTSSGGIRVRNSYVYNNEVHDVTMAQYFNQVPITGEIDTSMARTRYAVQIYGDSIAEHNTIYDVGYIALRFNDGASHLFKNLILDNCLQLPDGSGIYCYGKNNPISGSIVENNILIGQKNYPIDWWNEGLYIDEETSDTIWRNNTVLGFRQSMQMNRPSGVGNTIKNNNFYLPREASINLNNGKNREISNNKCFQENNWETFDFRAFGTFDDNIGILDNNRYFNPNQTRAVQATASDQATTSYVLSDWKIRSGQDSNSTDDNGLTITDSKCYYNTTDDILNQVLPAGIWSDLDGILYSSNINIQPFEGVILILAEEIQLNPEKPQLISVELE